MYYPDRFQADLVVFCSRLFSFLKEMGTAKRKWYENSQFGLVAVVYQARDSVLGTDEKGAYKKGWLMGLGYRVGY